MSLFNVTWDVAPLLLNYLESNWGTLADSSNPAAPEKFRLVTEDEDGNQSRGWDPASYDYVMVKETPESRNTTPADGPRDVFDLSNNAQVRVTTPKSRARRTELWEEVLVLFKGARKRQATPGTPGSWDTCTLEPQSVPDEHLNYWLTEGAWVFEAKGRTI